jgi:transcriptional regulator with XRE-family HTH domain
MATELSNAELDRLSGLRKGHTWALERKDDANPELHTITAIAETLGTTVGYLASGEGDGPTPAAVQAAVTRARAAKAEKGAA